MKRFLQHLGVAVPTIILAIGVIAATAPPPSLILLTSVRGLQWIDVAHGGSIARLTIHCSAALINTTPPTWITAAHCVADPTGKGIMPRDYFVDGQLAIIVKADFDADLAVLSTGKFVGVPALVLAKDAPLARDEVVIAGYPYGLDATITSGHVMRPSQKSNQGTYMVLAVISCPGISGGPVVNSRNELISVILASQGQGCGSVAGGAPYDVVKTFAGIYFGKS